MITHDEQKRFLAACERAGTSGAGGIGTLGERTLHAALKWYYDPTGEGHERKVGRYVVDVLHDDGIVEIQTRGMSAIRPKLASLLEEYPVTLVHPLAAEKWLCWVDPETGAVTQPRRSPKRAVPCDAMGELGRIHALLGHPNLRLHFPLVTLTEYRMQDGWGNGGKRGSHRAERIPHELIDILRVEGPADYALFLPEGLVDPFSVRDLQRAARVSGNCAGTCARLLARLGILAQCGKRGNAFLYERKKG